ncbi:LysR family transcriptional regulator [Bacillus sp. Marseille-P3661]|uniref:LysR family transcriptional regulator n=1 Tax=Bacillus sp. Marseille-P3661 TaxID=1936234 RepID=UPI000C83EBBF|nr:LysR family transcriptional regulator [Bacillus sp. Marseille-P3661]
MDIKQIKYFLQICESKSFSKAAQHLYITQQGLSKAIKVLEEELEVPLFYRTKAGILLTEYGECLRSKSQNILKESNILMDEMDKLKGSNNSIINVAFAFGVLNALPTNFVTTFRDKYPNIQLNIKEYPDYDCEETIRNEKADIGFTISPIDSIDMDYSVIKSEKVCLLVNKKNPLSEKAFVDFGEIKNEKIIIVNENFKTYHNFISRCRKAGFEPNIDLSTMELILVHNLSIANCGVGVSVESVSNQIPNVNVVRFKDENFTWEICLTTKKGKSLTAATKKFMKYTLKMNEIEANIPVYK